MSRKSSEKIMEVLKNLKEHGSDRHLITFSNINKIGIYPYISVVKKEKGGDSTPIGFYAYPVKSSFEKYGTLINFPFANFRKYIIITRLKEEAKVLFNSSEYYKSNKFTLDFLKSMFSLIKEVVPDEDIKRNGYVFYFVKNLYTAGGFFINLDKIDSWDELYEKLYVFIKRKNITFNNIMKYIHYFLKDIYGSRAVVLTKIFRNMGFDAVIDNSMNEKDAIIHPNEPVQAVVFDVGKLDIISIFDNPLYKYRYSKYGLLSIDYGGKQVFDKETEKKILNFYFGKRVKGKYDDKKVPFVVSKIIMDFLHRRLNEKQFKDILYGIVNEFVSVPDSYYGIVFSKNTNIIQEVIDELVNFLSREKILNLYDPVFFHYFLRTIISSHIKNLFNISPKTFLVVLSEKEPDLFYSLKENSIIIKYIIKAYPDDFINCYPDKFYKKLSVDDRRKFFDIIRNKKFKRLFLFNGYLLRYITEFLRGAKEDVMHDFFIEVPDVFYSDESILVENSTILETLKEKGVIIAK